SRSRASLPRVPHPRGDPVDGHDEGIAEPLVGVSRPEPPQHLDLHEIDRIDVRNPYVDPINLVQIEVLRRLRAGDADERLRDAFVVTVNGIAAGMRNAG